MIIKTDQEIIQNYLSDAANIKGFCDSVYIPENEKDIVEIFKSCNINKTPITISGNGTSLTGARVPKGGIVVSTEKLNNIIEINTQHNYAVIQPGVLLSEFKSKVEEKNLFYPADPTEQNCFIGSTVATNASGARTFKFGSTRNFILELKIVLSTGEILILKRGQNFAVNNKISVKTENSRIINFTIPEIKMPETKNTAGYYCKNNMDVIDLFIGSEGTLGFIYEIKVKLLPYPERFFSTILFFENLDNSLQFINNLVKLSKTDSIIKPSAIEFFDEKSLSFLKEDFPQIPIDKKAAVWIEQDSTNLDFDNIFNLYIQLFDKYNINLDTAWVANNNPELVLFQNFRHAVSAKVSEYIVKHNLTKVGTDLAVPLDNFYSFYTQSICIVNSAGINYVAYGHFGNSHLHLNMLPINNQQLNAAKQIYMDLNKLALFFKGTISAEHGIGKLKTNYLLLMYGEDVIKKFAEIKKVFDPNLILCIGNIIEPKYFT
ncbi:MAG: FAD-binding oxidoreductase [bacterium]